MTFNTFTSMNMSRSMFCWSSVQQYLKQGVIMFTLEFDRHKWVWASQKKKKRNIHFWRNHSFVWSLTLNYTREFILPLGQSNSDYHKSQTFINKKYPLVRMRRKLFTGINNICVLSCNPKNQTRYLPSSLQTSRWNVKWIFVYQENQRRKVKI